MSAEFVDTNILVYAHDRTSPEKQRISIDLLVRLDAERNGHFSTQVLLEFYSAAEDVVESARLSAKHSLSIWDALIVHSAVRSGCNVLWSEDLQHGRRFQTLIIRNPFLQT